MNEESCTFPGDGGRTVEGFFVSPDGPGTKPALVLIFDIWGLGDHIKSVARRFCQEGYVVLVPDLFTGHLKTQMTTENIMAAFRVMGVPAESRTPEDQAVIKPLLEVLSSESKGGFTRDLEGAFNFLAKQTVVDPTRIGSLGFCFGGGMSARLATAEPQLKACVIFYGENPPIDRVVNIEASVLGLYGGADARITDTVPVFEEAMKDAGKEFEFHIYEGAPHAFFHDGKDTYRPDAASDAWIRVTDFLRRELQNA